MFEQACCKSQSINHSYLGFQSCVTSISGSEKEGLYVLLVLCVLSSAILKEGGVRNQGPNPSLETAALSLDALCFGGGTLPPRSHFSLCEINTNPILPSHYSPLAN